jgi:CRP-like cAMP-binding protein
VLFREGEEGTTLYVIKSGRVRLQKSVHETQVGLGELGPGAFCGELALINDQPRPVTATVVEDASLLKVDAEQFETMVEKNSDIALRMLKKMGQRLTEAQYRVTNLILRSPAGRIVRQLRTEAMRAGDDDRLTTATPIPDDLADVLALEVGEVKLVLQDLIDRDLIDVDDGGTFTIVDPDAFERFLNYLELRDQFEHPDN